MYAHVSDVCPDEMGVCHTWMHVYTLGGRRFNPCTNNLNYYGKQRCSGMLYNFIGVCVFFSPLYYNIVLFTII